MESIGIALLIVVIAVAIFAFTNGFHDAADMVAAAIASRAIRPAVAIGVVCIFTFIAPFTIGLAVADTIGTFVDIGSASRVAGEKPGHVKWRTAAAIVTGWWLNLPVSILLGWAYCSLYLEIRN